MVGNGIRLSGDASLDTATMLSTKRLAMIIRIIIAMDVDDRQIMILLVSKKEMKRSNVVFSTDGLPHHLHRHHHQFTTSIALSHVTTITDMPVRSTTSVILVMALSHLHSKVATT